MASFEQEKGRVEELMRRLRLTVSRISDPNEAGEPDKGVDCIVDLAADRRIGVQVTELDPWPTPGMRGSERKLAEAGPYGMYAQNDAEVVLDAIARAIERKVAIATRHNFDAWLDEVWLLICLGVPEQPASTLVPTGWLRAEEIERKTEVHLRCSKYHHCFLLVVVGAERTLYRRERGKTWEKSVELPDISESPNAAYTAALLAARAAGDMEEVDRLTQQEVAQTLRDLRTK
jgi:hypothetical protein